MSTKIKYYAATLKLGHTSRKYYIPVTFGIYARSKKEAAQIAKTIPRVKRDHKDYLLNLREITLEEYNEIIEKNNHDPYLKCKNRKEQDKLDLSDRLVEDPHYKEVNKKRKKEKIKHKVYFKKDRITNPKKYSKCHNDYKEEAIYEYETSFYSRSWEEFNYI